MVFKILIASIKKISEVVKQTAKIEGVILSFEIGMRKPMTPEAKKSWPKVKKILEIVFNCKRLDLSLPKTIFLKKIKKERFIDLVVERIYLTVNEKQYLEFSI